MALWGTDTAAHCTALFKPVWSAGDVLPDIGPPSGSQFTPASLLVARQSLTVSVSYGHRQSWGRLRLIPL